MSVHGFGIARVSIELSQRCKEACSFCYSGSHAGGKTEFLPQEVMAFVRALAAHGVRAVSFEGGGPSNTRAFDVLRARSRAIFFAR